MYSENYQTNIITFIDILPKESLKYLLLDATPKPEERCEAPWTNNTKIRFSSFVDLREYLNLCFAKEMRIMSLHTVYEDKSFIYLDVLIPKVKVFNSMKMTPETLAAAGLLGPNGFVQYYELVF
jgi:hypothetical protein